MTEIFSFISTSFIPIITLLIVLYGLSKKAPIYDYFIEGAKDGLKMSVEILPFLIGIFLAVNSLTASGILNLIDKYEIDTVAFEDIQLQQSVNGRETVNNVQTFKILAEVFGVIYELVVALEIPYTVVLSNTWKSTLLIKGARRDEQKRNAQEYVQKTYGIKATQDECDSICIGAYACANADAETADFDWS